MSTSLKMPATCAGETLGHKSYTRQSLNLKTTMFHNNCHESVMNFISEKVNLHTKEHERKNLHK